MGIVSNQRRIILYKNILSSYPSKVKKYIINSVLKDKKYNPDLTTLIKVSKNKDINSCLWFDLSSFKDLSNFIPFKFYQFAKKFIQEIDIIIVGVGSQENHKEFFLEFSNTKINIIKKIFKSLKNYFFYDFSNIVEKVKELKNSLDKNNYFMIGVKYEKLDIKEIKFYFNVNKKMILSAGLPRDFLLLLEKFGLKKFRAEKSYLIKENGEFLEKIGWMLNCNFLSNFDIFINIFGRLGWTDPLIKRLNLYAQEEYASFLRWGWFSYFYSGENIQAINIALNYNDGK
ncbi:MAG: hypothetical protein K9L76_01365 [Candidatus Omnitrophica bacterium]|nr:hypothetical protein [Candidatus Omnitrophota bacterium]